MKTDLSKVFTISGEHGLFTYVAQAVKGVILESMETKKRSMAGASAKMSALSDISIYSKTDELKLKEVFEKMKKALGEEKAPSGKSDPKALKEFFDKVFPDYDETRFYPSHMKKVVEWYNALKEYASLDFEEEDSGEVKGSKASESKEKDAARKAEAKQSKSGKASAKQPGATKSNVPRKVI